jgi:hypothetical protein
MILLTGTLLAHGRRAVASALRHTGNERETNFSTFHQVLNRARWSPNQSIATTGKVGSSFWPRVPQTGEDAQ